MAALDDVLTWSEATLAVLGVLAVIGVAVKSIYKMARNVEKLLETSSRNEVELIEIRKQVTFNGGASLKDAVGRIDTRMAALEKFVHKAE